LHTLYKYLFVFILFAGCHKRDEVKKNPSPGDCYDFPLPSSSSGYDLKPAPKLWSGALFNPSDNDELIYTIQSNDSAWAYLTKFSNLNNTHLFCKSPLTVGAWNRSGWILLIDYLAGDIYKIKQNGDSLSLITKSTTMNFYADLSPDGSKIVFFGESNSNEAGLYIINSDGNAEHLFVTGVNYPKWSPDGRRIACANSNALYTIDTATKEKTQITNFSIDEWYGQMCWYPDSKWLIYTTNLGLYKINTQTREKVLLRNCCDSRQYLLPNVFNNGKILVSRTDLKIIQPNTKYYEQHVVMMNADGTNETLVDLK
jgi:Tol biopolymer transport system component